MGEATQILLANSGAVLTALDGSTHVIEQIIEALKDFPDHWMVEDVFAVQLFHALRFFDPVHHERFGIGTAIRAGLDNLVVIDVAKQLIVLAKPEGDAYMARHRWSFKQLNAGQAGWEDLSRTVWKTGRAPVSLS